MKISISGKIEPVHLTVFPLHEGEKGRLFEEADKLSGGLAKGLSQKEFTGKAGQSALLHGASGKRVLLYGLGKKADFTYDLLRQVGGVCAKSAAELELDNVQLAMPEKIDAYEGASASVQGAILGSYKFDKHFTSADAKTKPVKEIVLAIGGLDSKRAGAGAKFGEITANASNFSRELSNESGADAYPQALAARIEKEAKAHGLSVKVLDAQECRKLGMNSFLGVSQGSTRPPALVVVEYKPAGAKGKPIALVGKGITFDSGGISLKPGANMDKMKHDKSGACTVAATMIALAQLKVPRHVIGIMPFCENMPDGGAAKPGDIFRAMNGKTIEVLNTDAEGRLILADALCYAVKECKPGAIIDLATLTGAAVVALGDVCSAIMTNDEKLASRVKEAGEKEWERVWPLPMYKEYDEKVKSTVADVKNLGGPQGEAGTIAGASFLKNFVGEVPWVHLDIAATAWVEKPGVYYALGATGVGVRLLSRMLSEWKD